MGDFVDVGSTGGSLGLLPWCVGLGGVMLMAWLGSSSSNDDDDSSPGGGIMQPVA